MFHLLAKREPSIDWVAGYGGKKGMPEGSWRTQVQMEGHREKRGKGLQWPAQVKNRGRAEGSRRRFTASLTHRAFALDRPSEGDKRQSTRQTTVSPDNMPIQNASAELFLTCVQKWLTRKKTIQENIEETILALIPCRLWLETKMKAVLFVEWRKLPARHPSGVLGSVKVSLSSAPHPSTAAPVHVHTFMHTHIYTHTYSDALTYTHIYSHTFIQYTHTHSHRLTYTHVQSYMLQHAHRHTHSSSYHTWCQRWPQISSCRGPNPSSGDNQVRHNGITVDFSKCSNIWFLFFFLFIYL